MRHSTSPIFSLNSTPFRISMIKKLAAEQRYHISHFDSKSSPSSSPRSPPPAHDRHRISKIPCPPNLQILDLPHKRKANLDFNPSITLLPIAIPSRRRLRHTTSDLRTSFSHAKTPPRAALIYLTQSQGAPRSLLQAAKGRSIPGRDPIPARV